MAEPVSRRALLFGLPAAARARRAASVGTGRSPPGPATWEARDHRVLGRRLEPAAEQILQASAAGPGKRLLDVAAGDGYVAQAAAREGADVVAVDPAPGLVARGRARSEACGLAVDWRVGDAESLSLDDACFDCVASNFGIIRARDPRRVVDELDRVLRPGGSVLVTAWASAGLMGRVLRLAAQVEDRSPGGARPEWWGRYEGVQLAFSRFPGFEVRDSSLRWRFASADAIWHELAAPSGPLAAAAGRDERLRERLMEIVEPFACRERDHVVLDVGYVLVVARKPQWARRVEAPTGIEPVYTALQWARCRGFGAPARR
jgi:SAM-dependent methyltransferase